mmetsp:Transcript_19574/g.36845  ORF Transcript_19574/g.36845 Transcript_19574/m.36845 type:complete len:163 (+) Transcript_19574:913-1401(+)
MIPPNEKMIISACDTYVPQLEVMDDPTSTSGYFCFAIDLLSPSICSIIRRVREGKLDGNDEKLLERSYVASVQLALMIKRMKKKFSCVVDMEKKIETLSLDPCIDDSTRLKLVRGLQFPTSTTSSSTYLNLTRRTLFTFKNLKILNLLIFLNALTIDKSFKS